jgi:hypothetical protein
LWWVQGHELMSLLLGLSSEFNDIINLTTIRYKDLTYLISTIHRLLKWEFSRNAH